jgi:hypothetical protein
MYTAELCPPSQFSRTAKKRTWALP